ncbi:unnamed protein product [Porites evermanni]|uniref:Uncharacterized protein n=1 Tax=Porites evermanni TaxID=104178 RepID=A0ABN8SKH7_9CNID|nr:unnamed protein product [Porites evermanni]
MKDGLFASKCVKSSQLTRENVTLTSYLFQYEPGERDEYDFNIDPSNLPFSSWDYKAMKSVSYNDSLPEMFSTYLSYIMNKCIDKLRSGRLKLEVILCDCMMIDPFLPVDLTYDWHLTSLIEYHNIIPDFQHYLRAALIESYSETELESFRKQRKKLPSIKTISSDLGLEPRDYVRNENTVFPFKSAVNCCRVNLNRGDEFTLEWTLPTSSQ